MLTQEFAKQFASDWIDAWNDHAVDRVLAHYADDFEMSSPLIVKIAGQPSGKLKGKHAVGAYWRKALEQLGPIRLELHMTLVGTDSLVLYYRGRRGMAAEVFFFNSAGQVTRAAAHYA
ncbi:nuclear transport factor 2 family protein [Nitrospira sp. Nam74]